MLEIHPKTLTILIPGKAHLTAGVGPGRYKVDNLGIGKEGRRCVVRSRYKEGVQTGPPNALVQPVDTLGQ